MRKQCLQRPAEQTPGKKVRGDRGEDSTHTTGNLLLLPFSVWMHWFAMLSVYVSLCVIDCRPTADWHTQTAEIIMFDDYLVVYKCLGDLMFYVTGSLAENELILHAVLTAFYEATSTLLR